MGLWQNIMGWFRPSGGTRAPEPAAAPKFSQDEIEAATWFQAQFREQAERVLQGTPFTFALVLAIAMQETSYLWTRFYKKMAPGDVLKLCVGDTFDAPNRDAFPKNKRALLAASNGAQMFDVARAALVSIGKHDNDYRKVAQNENKFCHGYGIFQYDLQFFETNPEFFLQEKWSDFAECLKVLKQELVEALKRAYRTPKETLTEREMVFVAIAYNAGSVNTQGSFKQGFKDDSGQFYGEKIWRYIQLARLLPPPPKPATPDAKPDDTRPDQPPLTS
jgi:hypothetical protein